MAKYIKVYFKVISTSLRKDADLVSIGMIVNDPSIQFKSSLYIELTDYSQNKVTEWLDRKIIQNLLSNEEFATLNRPWVFKCNKAEAEGYIFAWLNQIYDHINAKDKEPYKIKLVGDICAHEFQALSDLLHHHPSNSEAIPSTYIDLNDRIQSMYITAYQAFKCVRSVLVRDLEGYLDSHMIPPSFDERDRERLIPQLIREKANNALNKAFNISQLDMYMDDIDRLCILDD